MWAITNLTAGGNQDQVHSTHHTHNIYPPLSLQVVYILEASALKPLCDLLVVKDPKIVQVLLDAILNILNVSAVDHSLDEHMM